MYAKFLEISGFKQLKKLQDDKSLTVIGKALFLLVFNYNSYQSCTVSKTLPFVCHYSTRP